MRILIAEPDDFSAVALERLAQVGSVDMRHISSFELPEVLSAYDVVWFRLAHRIDRALLDRVGTALRCKIIATPVTGLDHLDLGACSDSGIRVISLRGEVAFLRTVRATAELTLGLALALLRKIPAAAGSVLEGHWNRDAFRGRELFEKRAGVVGLGRLGSITAGYFAAFGMEVAAYDPRIDFPHELAHRANSLSDLCERSDLLSVHVSYSPETHHLIDSAALSRLPDGAILINTSRGGVVDDRALIEALESGRLAGAALDVLDGEPNITVDNRLIAFAKRFPERLLIVPHIGGNTVESFAKTELFLAERVATALSASSAGGES